MYKEQEKQRTIRDKNLQEVRQHGTKDFPLAVYMDDFAEFEQGRIPWHWHDEVQFDVVLEGCIQFQIGSKLFELSEGQAIFINSGVLHQIFPTNGLGGKIVAYVLRSGLLEADRLSAVYQNCLVPILKGQIDCIVFQQIERLDKTILALLGEIKELYQTKGVGWQIEVKGLLCCIWSNLLKKEKQERGIVSTKEHRDMDRVKTAITFMQSHYQDALSLAQIAESTALSRSELCRCFRRVMGITPYEYLIQYRVQEAAKKIRQTDGRILDIALSCGFDSLGHMGRYFRKYCGCTPSSFRKGEYSYS